VFYWHVLAAAAVAGVMSAWSSDRRAKQVITLLLSSLVFCQLSLS